LQNKVAEFATEDAFGQDLHDPPRAQPPLNRKRPPSWLLKVLKEKLASPSGAPEGNRKQGKLVYAYVEERESESTPSTPTWTPKVFLFPPN